MNADPKPNTNAKMDTDPNTNANMDADQEANMDADMDLDADMDPDKLLVLLFRLRNLMQHQLMELNCAFRTGKENYLDCVPEEDMSMNIQDELQSDLEKVKVAVLNKILTLKRLQIRDALWKKMEKKDNTSRKIMETADDIQKLSVALIHNQQQLHQKERNFIDIKRKRYLLRNVGSRKMLKVLALMKQQKEKASTEVSTIEEDNLQKEIEMTTVIQNTFQHVLFGSNINWAEDPSLKKIILELEKNVNFL